MTAEVELLVELKIPDTNAITTYHTLQRFGYNNLKKVRRMDYYRFRIDGDFKKFAEKIVKVDVLVNANKHKYYLQKNFSLRNFFDDGIFVLVKNDYQESGLLSVLQKRLGFKEIKSMEKGILWGLYFEDADKSQAKNLAMEIAQKLLVNENYQGFVVFA